MGANSIDCDYVQNLTYWSMVIFYILSEEYVFKTPHSVFLFICKWYILFISEGV